MPVASGMVLKVWISPADRGDALYVKEARVLWARAQEFGLELRQVDVKDHQWLISFFRECGAYHSIPSSLSLREQHVQIYGGQ
jgi:hypothetical protein